MTAGRLFVVGSLNLDLVVRVHRHPRPGETVLGGNASSRWGGKGANQAMAAARAAVSDTPINFIGRVGDDPAGHQYIARLRAHGINTDALFPTEGSPTGTAFIAVDDKGENTIIVSSGANALLATADLGPLSTLGPNDVVITTLEAPMPTVERASELAATAGARFVLNLSPARPIRRDILDRADPVIVNEHEAAYLGSRHVKPASLLITRGAQGADWGEIHVPARPTQVVDTTGAGDAFCGALAAGLAKSGDHVVAMEMASLAAAEVVSHAGAQIER